MSSAAAACTNVAVQILLSDAALGRKSQTLATQEARDRIPRNSRYREAEHGSIRAFDRGGCIQRAG